MHIAIASSGQTLDAPIDARFGRAAFFQIVDSATLAFSVHPNPAIHTAVGAASRPVSIRRRKELKRWLPTTRPTDARAGKCRRCVLIKGRGTVRDNVTACNEGKLVNLTKSGPACGERLRL